MIKIKIIQNNTRKVNDDCKNEEIRNAEMKMSKYQIRRLPICDENNHVIGMLTLGDLAQNCDEIGKQNVCNTIQNICDTNNTKNAE